MIPTVDQCRKFMEEHEMLDNIRAHSFVVARIAELLTRKFVESGSDINLELAIAGALLHDIGKTSCLNNDRNHARVGSEICVENDMGELEEIVAEHVILRNGLSSSGCTEKEIVYYADKRVRHDEVVSLDERLEYILERYGNGDERLKALICDNFETCRRLEEKLFSRLPFAPAEVSGIVAGTGVGFKFVVPLETGM